jgi:hypothetical protein
MPRFFLNLRNEETKNFCASAIRTGYRRDLSSRNGATQPLFYRRFVRTVDGIIHFDETRAVEPLDEISGWTHEDAPETFPKDFKKWKMKRESEKR